MYSSPRANSIDTACRDRPAASIAPYRCCSSSVGGTAEVVVVDGPRPTPARCRWLPGGGSRHGRWWNRVLLSVRATVVQPGSISHGFVHVTTRHMIGPDAADLVVAVAVAEDGAAVLAVAARRGTGTWCCCPGRPRTNRSRSWGTACCSPCSSGRRRRRSRSCRPSTSRRGACPAGRSSGRRSGSRTRCSRRSRGRCSCSSGRGTSRPRRTRCRVAGRRWARRR